MYWGITELFFFVAQSISSQIFENKTNKETKIKKQQQQKLQKKKNEKAAVIHRLVKFVHDEHAYLKEGTSYNSSWIHENMANENTAI